MKTLHNIIAVAVLLSTASIANAQAPEGGETKPERKLPPELLAKFDKDGDGKLNDDERAALKAAGEAKMEERKKEAIAKFDKDGDGKLDEEERKAAREAMGARPDGPKRPGRPGGPKGPGGPGREKPKGE